MKKLIIIGGHGNGSVVQSTVEDINAAGKQWDLLGFVNDGELPEVNGYPVLGAINKELIAPLLSDPDTFFIYTLISVKLNYRSISKLLDLKIPINRFATIIHPTAVVSNYAQIGHGVSIQPFVSVGPNAVIGNHVQVFAQALVGHGAWLGDYSYVANNACVGAKVKLHEGAYLGTNATTLESISLGAWSVTGMGSVVLKDVPDYTKVAGNPTRHIGTVR